MDGRTVTAVCLASLVRVSQTGGEGFFGFGLGCEQLDALSVWFYNLVYVYILSIKVENCGFGDLLQIS